MDKIIVDISFVIVSFKKLPNEVIEDRLYLGTPRSNFSTVRVFRAFEICLFFLYFSVCFLDLFLFDLSFSSLFTNLKLLFYRKSNFIAFVDSFAWQFW